MSSHGKSTFVSLHDVNAGAHGVIVSLLSLDTPLGAIDSIDACDAAATHLFKIDFVRDSSASDIRHKLVIAAVKCVLFEPHALVGGDSGSGLVAIESNIVTEKLLTGIDCLLNSILFDLVAEVVSAGKGGAKRCKSESLHIYHNFKL